MSLPTSGPTPAASGRHPVNISHLVMGIAFLGLVAVWALYQGGVATGSELRWLMPLPWIVAGAVGLAASLLNHRTTTTEEIR